MDILKNKKLFLLDMDGTIFIEDKLIPGAIDFIETLISQNKRYIFLTNNSSKGIKAYVSKLNKMGIKANADNIFTSGIATALHIKEKNLPSNAFVVGTKSFKEQLTDYGISVIENASLASILIVGYDTELNYKKLVIACELINQGVPYLATNPDLVCPIANGKFIPDCGSICNMLETATTKKPFYIGKPRKEMIEIVAKKEKTNLSDIAIIGDRLYTDISCGKNAGITTIAVLSGETKIQDIENSSIKPDYIFNSIYDIYESIK